MNGWVGTRAHTHRSVNHVLFVGTLKHRQYTQKTWSADHTITLCCQRVAHRISSVWAQNFHEQSTRDQTDDFSRNRAHSSFCSLHKQKRLRISCPHTISVKFGICGWEKFSCRKNFAKIQIFRGKSLKKWFVWKKIQEKSI